MIKTTKKTTKRILAIPAAVPAIPVNPNRPATIATTRKISAHCNISFPPEKMVMTNSDENLRHTKKMAILYFDYWPASLKIRDSM